jgi:hypothetical protein
MDLHWLLTAGQVNNAEAGMTQCGAAFDVQSALVRAAMTQGFHHAIKRKRSERRRVLTDDSGNATHIWSGQLSMLSQLDKQFGFHRTKKNPEKPDMRGDLSGVSEVKCALISSDEENFFIL